MPTRPTISLSSIRNKTTIPGQSKRGSENWRQINLHAKLLYSPCLHFEYISPNFVRTHVSRLCLLWTNVCLFCEFSACNASSLVCASRRLTRRWCAAPSKVIHSSSCDLTAIHPPQPLSAYSMIRPAIFAIYKTFKIILQLWASWDTVQVSIYLWYRLLSCCWP